MMNRMLICHGGIVLAVLLWAASAGATPLPACASHIEVSGAKVIRVENNGVLVLADGRAVDLEGVLLPLGRRDHAHSGFARAAIDTLRQMTRHDRATLVAEPPKEDRYGRLRAQVFLSGIPAENWLQRALLLKGLARVNIAPDRRECASALYAAEREARHRGEGIWASAAYAVRRPDQLSRDVGTFQIVEGVVKAADVRGGRAYINFGSDWRSDFTATIAPDDMDAFRKAGFDPRDLVGKRVRVRGWIESMNGPEIELADPDAIEIAGTDGAM